jgi:hypothetical protein
MGYYIQSTSKNQPLANKKKAEALIADGATVVEPIYQPNLICVVENGAFDAAGYCYSQSEFEAFLDDDGRKKTWLTHPDARELSGYEA